MSASKFHWFVAWRYLMERVRCFSPVIRGLGVALLLAAVVALIVGRFVVDQPGEYRLGSPHRELYLLSALVLGVLAVSVLLVGAIRYVFTFFTTVSIAGLMVGTGALVVVLSVMNGFETDIRKKILGSNAHIRITHKDGTFTGYRKVAERIRGVPGVVADTAYLSSEVIVVADDNSDSVVIKGIQPKSVSAVTDLGGYIHQKGALDRLQPASAGNDAGISVREHRPDAGVVVDPAPPDMEVGDDAPTDFSGGGDAGSIHEEESKRWPTTASDVWAVVDPAPGDMDVGDEEPVDLSGATRPETALEGLYLEEAAGFPMIDTVSQEIAALPGLIVGSELVDKVRLHVGQEVRIVSPLAEDTPMGPVPRTRSYRIAGTFFTGMYEYDLKFVYVELSSLQKFLDVDDEVTGIEVRVANPERTEQVLATLRNNLGPSYHVQDWKELNRSLFAALKLEKIAMFLVLVIIILVASFSIVGNLIMVVVEKAKQIAVLKTMGTSDAGVRKLFVTQGLGIGLAGTVLGVTWGLLLCLVIAKVGIPIPRDVYYIERMPIQVESAVVCAVALAGLVLSVFATVYPATLAARLRPVEGMRH